MAAYLADETVTGIGFKFDLLKLVRFQFDLVLWVLHCFFLSRNKGVRKSRLHFGHISGALGFRGYQECPHFLQVNFVICIFMVSILIYTYRFVKKKE